jgi:hypothetical protein
VISNFGDFMNLSYDNLKASLKKLGFLFFEGGEFDLNIIGVRTDDNSSNAFNDFLCVAYNDGFNNICRVYNVTTDPGVYYRKNPANVNGTAIVVPGQHRSGWQLGKHQGKYEAMVQKTEISVYRDADKDDQLDVEGSVVEKGFFGINCHRASAHNESKQVDKWSAGCQVHADPLQYDEFIALCKIAAEKWGNGFTYTLLKEDQVL